MQDRRIFIHAARHRWSSTRSFLYSSQLLFLHHSCRPSHYYLSLFLFCFLVLLHFVGAGSIESHHQHHQVEFLQSIYI